ncbi:MAG: PIG-L deacetylase family protein [Paracoccaceae bacterium]
MPLVRWRKPHWRRVATAYLDCHIDRFAPLKRISAGGAGHLVVLAPHPDDESIGCGGLIGAWTARGGSATVIVLTDGAAGDPALREASMSSQAREERTRALVSTRRAETEQALGILNARALWLDGTDGALGRDVPRLTGALSKILQDAPATLIAAPFPADRHPDHAATAQVLAGTASDLAPDTRVLAYEVWSPARITAVLDITDVASLKWQAIACHASQTATTDYETASRGLAAYRAISGGLEAGRLAEGFWDTNLRRYAALTGDLAL